MSLNVQYVDPADGRTKPGYAILIQSNFDWLNECARLEYGVWSSVEAFDARLAPRNVVVLRLERNPVVDDPDQSPDHVDRSAPSLAQVVAQHYQTWLDAKAALDGYALARPEFAGGTLWTPPQ